MAFKILPRTRETTATVGTGAITPSGAVAPNNRTFASQMADGDQTFACALSANGVNWEEGLYTWSSGTLVRTTILANSAGNTSPIALDGGRIFGIIPHDLQLLFVKLFQPSAHDEVVTWDASLGRFVSRYAGGRTWHRAVALATAAALPANTYSNGTSGVGATLTGNANGALTVDSVATVVGYRILVKDEATRAHNGIYEVTAAGDGSHPYVLTRTTDFDDAYDIQQADATVVGIAGAVNKLTIWVSVIPSPYTIGSGTIDWDMIVGLPQGGADGQVLTIDSGAPVWADPAGGGGSTWSIANAGAWDAATDYDPGDTTRDAADFYQAISPITAGATTAPDLDGHGQINGSGTTATSAITTTTADDLICLLIATETTGVTVSSVTSALTFTQIQAWSSGIYHLELWTARAAAVLTSESVVANLSASANFVMHLVGVKGTNATPRDANASLPKYVAGNSNVTGVSTSSLYDFILYFNHSDNPVGFNDSLFPSGFTFIGGTSFIPGQSTLSYKRVTTAQSNISVSDGNTTSSQALVVAFTAGNPPPHLDSAEWVRLSGFDSTAFDDVLGSTVGLIPQRGSGGWTGQTAAGLGITLDNLADVSTSGLSAGDVLKTNGTTWSHGTLSLDDLSDVVTSGGTSGQVLTLSGGSWGPADPTGGGGGGGGSGLYGNLLGTAPTKASTGLTTAVNVGSGAIVDVTDVGIEVTAPQTSGDSLVIAAKAASGTFTITALISLNATFQNYQNCGFGLRDSSGGRIAAWQMDLRSAGMYFSVARWNSMTSFNATYFENLDSQRQKWFQLEVNASNFIWRMASLGGDWVDFLTHSKTDWLPSFNQIIFYANRNNAIGTSSCKGTMLYFNQV